MSYCAYVASLETETTNPNKKYHDEYYGFELFDDDALFGRLLLEINQAGLSWTTILNKEENFYKAYDQFSIAKIAAYDELDVERLLQDKGIIRNQLKIRAAIYNAKRILELQKTFGSFKTWLHLHIGLELPEWVQVFKGQFKFVGVEIVNEFLMSSGLLEGAHDSCCPVYEKYRNQLPKKLLS